MFSNKITSPHLPFPVPERQTNERIVEASETTNVPPKVFISNLTLALATPSVKGLSIFELKNTAPQNVTNFTDGYDGQRIHIRGDGFTTLVNGATITTNTGANKLLATNKIYNFTRFGGVWIEDA